MTRQLTPYEQELVEMRITDFLAWERFDIAESLGIPIERDWTDEEAARIIAECDRLHRAGLVRDILSDDEQE